jgi:uncharacterized membrane protein
MLARDSLGSAMGVFLAGAAVTSGPWLLTTLVLVLMRVSAAGSGLAGAGEAERIITLVYASVIVLGAPADIVLSRYAADRVYEQRPDQIAAPLRRVLTMSLVGFAAVGALAMLLAGVGRGLAVPGIILTAIVGAQWLLLSAAGGLSSPDIILRSFAVGAPISILAALALSRPGGLGGAGYLYGFGAGQLATLALLLWGTLRALPEEEDEGARILPAFRDYWLLAAAAFAFHGGLWIDKLVVYLLAGGAVSGYAAMAAVAWLSVVPACACLFVAIETAFHRQFRAFYRALHAGASLPALESLADELRRECGRTLRSVATVQASVAILGLLAAPSVVSALALSGSDAAMLRWLVVGASLQVPALAATLLLHYFDFRREALAVALTQLAASALFTLLIGAPSAYLGAGYAAACGLTCAVGLALLRRRMARLLEHTFQSQPYAAEE